MSDSPPAIRTSQLTKQYGSITALSGLTMTVESGEVFGFLGPNGAGKTTAVKILVGLTAQTSGEAWLLGEPVGHRETRRRIGYLPELFRYQEWMSAREVLMLHCRLMGMPAAAHAPAVDEALNIVGLAERGFDHVRTFSKGMQQRLGLAVALLGEPRLVFLDEPTSALDPVGRHDVRQIIHELKVRGTTVFLNSHLLTEVEYVCDRVAVIDRGAVVALGTVEELRGSTHQLRLRVTGEQTEIRRVLERHEPIDSKDGWVVLRHVEPVDVPSLITALVGAGVQVHAVEPVRDTLEDRFLELLGGGADDRPDDRPADPA
jgi:ABC-2 type transport system ATP-binding protein